MKLSRKQPNDSADLQKTEKKNLKALEVSKVEVSEGLLKFFVAKGIGKKHWTVIREISISEIEDIEKVDDVLRVTWNDDTESFFTKESADIFVKVAEQVRTFDEQKKAQQQSEEVSLRKREILKLLQGSFPFINALFDILIGLQEKHIQWQEIDDYSNSLEKNINFANQTLPPINLDFSKVLSATKAQVPKDVSNEAFNLLKETFDYFNALESDKVGDSKSQQFYQTAKTMIKAYFLFNDLMLGSIVGDKENSEEITELDITLKYLADQNVVLDASDFKSNIEKMNFEICKQTFAGYTELFEEQLKQL